MLCDFLFLFKSTNDPGEQRWKLKKNFKKKKLNKIQETEKIENIDEISSEWITKSNAKLIQIL